MIGISSGAALGAVLAIALGVTIFGFYTLQTLAFVFSVAIVLVIYVFSLRSRRVPVLYLLLTGIAVCPPEKHSQCDRILSDVT